MYEDDEATAFEMSPLGARQRMLPTRTFLSRLPPSVPAPLQAPPMTVALAQPVLVYPPEISYPDAIDEIVASSSGSAMSSSEWAALPSASASMPSALPIASRRFRWLAVPLMSMLALVALGGAMWEPNETQGPSIAPGIASLEETSLTSVELVTASEDPAPIEEVPVVKKRAYARPAIAQPAKRVVAKQTRKVTVNSSTALGNLRPRKAW